MEKPEDIFDGLVTPDTALLYPADEADAVVLSLPLAPLCSPDCQGICPTCGERVELDGDPHDHPVSDPRWSALEQLLTESPPTMPEER